MAEQAYTQEETLAAFAALARDRRGRHRRRVHGRAPERHSRCSRARDAWSAARSDRTDDPARRPLSDSGARRGERGVLYRPCRKASGSANNRAARVDVGDRSDVDHAAGSKRATHILEPGSRRNATQTGVQRRPATTLTFGADAPPVWRTIAGRRRPADQHAQGVPPAIEDVDLEGPGRRSPERCSPDAVAEPERLLRIPENERGCSRPLRTSRACAVPATVIEFDVTRLGDRTGWPSWFVIDPSSCSRASTRPGNGACPGATASTPATRRFQYA